MNTFSNIFKKSFLQGITGSDITTSQIVVTLGVTAILALYIFIVYYFACKKSFYNRSFNISLALIAVITSAIILAMQSNLVISLGMVGALSIVRFRTAIKDPTDLMFLFWSISIGIICGADMYAIALLSSLVITIGLIVLDLTPVGKASMLLVVSGKNADAEEDILAAVKNYSKVCKVKSRNITPAGFNLLVEVKTDDGAALVKDVNAVKDITGVTLMAHDGEVTA